MTKTQRDIRKYTIRRKILKGLLFFSVLLAVVHTVLFDVNRETVWIWMFVGFIWFGVKRAEKWLDERIDKLKKRQAAYEARKNTRNTPAKTKKRNDTDHDNEEEAVEILKSLQQGRQKKTRSTRRKIQNGK